MTKPRVLIVEDEQDIAGLIKHALERGGDADAEIVGSGDAALQAAAERVPDLIILDLNLPVLSGLDVCRVLRSRSDVRHIPIIMLTARTSEDDRVSGLEQGADVTSPSPSACASCRPASAPSCGAARQPQARSPGARRPTGERTCLQILTQSPWLSMGLRSD